MCIGLWYPGYLDAFRWIAKVTNSLRDEFLAEAQEIIESLSRDLLLLDQAQKEGAEGASLVNEVFRGVHTLKGIAGMFGYHQLGSVAHALEDLLDELRLGKVELSQNVLDVLFEGVENFQRLLAGDESGKGQVDLEAYAASLEGVAATEQDASPLDELEHFGIDQSVLGVLTEYEEHRLRTNVKHGVGLYLLKVEFSLTSIDTSLEELKSRCENVAEIITYLPSADGGGADSIELDVILASAVPLESLQETIAMGRLEPMIRRAIESTTPRATVAPPSMVTASPGMVAPARQDRELSLRSLAKTVRVDIRKLDHLMNIVGELSIVRSAVGRVAEHFHEYPELRKMALDLHRINRGFERHLGELQDGILDVRMVPLGQVFDRLARVVRQSARDREKKVELVVTGADTEVDKLIVEELSDPLMHIIRNAIDHGIEIPDDRVESGKPTKGTLLLNAYQKGNHVVIEIEDDGAGIDPSKLIAKAVAAGVVPEEREELSDTDALALIFVPGISTRDGVSDLSGRGVGMDVVKTNISRLGGVVEVHSELAVGTKFTITLPVTLAIIGALLVKVEERDYAIPINSVREAIPFKPDEVRRVQGREVITLRGETLPISRLGKLFSKRTSTPGKSYVVVCSSGARRIGFVVDDLDGQRDIIVKSLGRSLEEVRGFSGATDLGDQHVALVIDAPALMEELLSDSVHAEVRV